MYCMFFAMVVVVEMVWEDRKGSQGEEKIRVGMRVAVV